MIATLKEYFREHSWFYLGRYLLIQIVFYNTLFSIPIYILVTLMAREAQQDAFWITFGFTQIIATTISLVFELTKYWHKDLPVNKRIPVYFLMILIPGSIAVQVAYLILQMIFPVLTDNDVTFEQLFTFSLIMAFIFGTMQAVYIFYEYRVKQLSERLIDGALEKERLKNLQKMAELEALRNKIDPHFLFNTLNSIASLISTNPGLAEKMVERLSALFRYSLTAANQDRVPLAEEIKIVKKYLNIEKIRLDDRLEFEIKVTPEAEQVNIPPLLLQPLVENSIKHVISKSENGGFVNVYAEVSGSQLSIRIIDSGPGFELQEGETEESGFGVRSVIDRLRLIYGTKSDVSLSQKPHFTIHLNVPLEETS
jgi:two-component system LytT family sensor kinase